MNKKTLKVTAAIAICCVLMVVVVIYTPKPTPEPTKGRETLEENFQRLEKERAHLKLGDEALGKAIEAIKAIHEVHELIREEKADLKPLIEANTRAIEGLTEASEAVKQRTEELQCLNEEKAPLKSLVEANIKANTELIAVLTEVSEAMKALTEVLERLNAENADLPLRLFMDTIYKASLTISKALDANRKASKANFEYQKAMIDARRW